MANLIPRIEFAAQAFFLSQRQCPFCDGLDHSVVARKMGIIRIRRCQACCLYFTDPIYRSRLGDLYDSLYRAEGSTTTLPDLGGLARLKATDFVGSDKFCGPQLAALRRLGAGRLLLEVGSSWGYFLFQARVAGFEAVGVEPARRRREFGAHHLQVDVKTSIEDIPIASVNVIYSAHTLEHVGEAGRFLSACRRRLRPAGLFVCEVPNFDFEAFPKRALSIIGAVHPLGLSREFFERALPHAGFDLLGVFARWESVPSGPPAHQDARNLIVVGRRRADSSGHGATGSDMVSRQSEK